jgi:hypothetical protein
VCDLRGAHIGDRRLTRHLCICDARFTFGRCSRSRFGLGARGFLETHRFDARGFDPRGFCSNCFLLSCQRRCGFGGRGNRGRLLLGSRLHVSGFAATADRLGSACGLRDGHRFRRGGATTASDGRRRGLLLSTNTLLALPAGADASHLVVGEHTHMAANGYVHLPKK